MKTVTATDIKNHFGQYLERSLLGPVIIEKTGRPVAVIVSMEDYERLAALEDRYWVQLADRAEKTGYLGKKASGEFLKSK